MENERLNLADIEKIPFEKADFVKNFGKTLVVAPHADDESLGCGGAIALLRKSNIEVSILLLSDGTLSHPNSRKFPKEKLRELRENELLKAAEILGVTHENVHFFRYRDRSVPDKNAAEFAEAVSRAREFLQTQNPQTIFLPWRRDPHPDHRAAFDIFDAAKSVEHQIIEYPIWLYELAASDDAPLAAEVSAFRLDISEVAELKQQAVRAHVSQLTDLIDDDPNGFRLSAEVLQNFNLPYEIFLTATPINTGQKSKNLRQSERLI